MSRGQDPSRDESGSYEKRKHLVTVNPNTVFWRNVRTTLQTEGCKPCAARMTTNGRRPYARNQLRKFPTRLYDTYKEQPGHDWIVPSSRRKSGLQTQCLTIGQRNTLLGSCRRCKRKMLTTRESFQQAEMTRNCVLEKRRISLARS